ncbi:hypothetical protein B0T18DRAFT_406648 [Schizothecium vesticola]|uniref:Uncharacterized protein n=1 Tax=Schizothecium vesticola TaxID=314040 RepID=A0AA40F215_9PEZI|nr:hypothetical protein B0T18DRAFT_406648 [Schizothecium vesticola]
MPCMARMPRPKYLQLGRSFLFLFLTFQCRRCERPLQLSLALAQDDSRERVYRCPRRAQGRSQNNISRTLPQEVGQR